MHSLQDYSYFLPEHLIAQTPASPPESCKFLIHKKNTWTNSDHLFWELPTLIEPSTLIIFNNSKVIKARLTWLPKDETTPGKKKKRGVPTYSKFLEIFYLTSVEKSKYSFIWLISDGKKFKVWSTIYFNESIHFQVDAIVHEWRQFTCNIPILEVLETYGQMPLPPYIWYTKEKESPYQSIFASKVWSVAAPTASLHFTPTILKKLEEKWVQTLYTTLHIWLGTFKQVDTQDITSYNIHSERIEVDKNIFQKLSKARRDGKRILAVGTTVTRTLESLPYLYVLIKEQSRIFVKNEYREEVCTNISLEIASKYVANISIEEEYFSFDSTLYLYPWSNFYVIDELITNFHLPKTSLLMLVAAWMWFDAMKAAYEHAIEHQYRFYSFGDAMWIK